jgi:L-asparaginase
VISLGGTIAMIGQPARPAVSGEELAAAVPGLDTAGLVFTSAANVPGAHITLAQALDFARLACRVPPDGGVVVTQGTDTLEEMAFLCDLLWDGDNPIVFTGAMRPGSAPGADGPANILDAVAVARSAEARGLGVVVAFAGELHAARDVRKDSSTSLTPFASPHLGPLGHVHEGRVRIAARPDRTPVLSPAHLDARVEIAVVGLGDDGAPIRQATAAGVDGVVVALLGAGHGSPGVLHAIQEALEHGIATVLTCRPRTGFLLHGTYGFSGAEGDMRATGAAPAAALSPAAARMALLACLGAGLDQDGIRRTLAPFDV